MHPPEIQLIIGAEGDTERRRRETTRGVQGDAPRGKFLNQVPRKWDFLHFESNIQHKRMLQNEEFL